MLEVDKKIFYVLVTKKDDFIVEFSNGEGGKRHVKVDKYYNKQWTRYSFLLENLLKQPPNEQFI